MVVLVPSLKYALSLLYDVTLFESCISKPVDDISVVVESSEKRKLLWYSSYNQSPMVKSVRLAIPLNLPLKVTNGELFRRRVSFCAHHIRIYIPDLSPAFKL